MITKLFRVQKLKESIKKIIIFSLSSIVILSFFTSTYIYYLWYKTPLILESTKFDNYKGILIKDQNEEIREFTPGIGSFPYLKYEDIDPDIILAFLALEDRFYFSNTTGVPIRSVIARSIDCVIQFGEDCGGGSGISQQLIKNLTFNNKKNFNRKIDEYLISLKLNQNLPRKNILEIYLNKIYFGAGQTGIASAIKRFLRYKENTDINLIDACTLAALVRSPNYYYEGIRTNNKQVINDYQFRVNQCLNSIGLVFLPNDVKQDFTNSLEEYDRLIPAKGIFINSYEQITQAVGKFINQEQSLYQRNILQSSINNSAKTTSSENKSKVSLLKEISPRLEQYGNYTLYVKCQDEICSDPLLYPAKIFNYPITVEELEEYHQQKLGSHTNIEIFDINEMYFVILISWILIIITYKYFTIKPSYRIKN